jgi:hypothetical protein
MGTSLTRHNRHSTEAQPWSARGWSIVSPGKMPCYGLCLMVVVHGALSSFKKFLMCSGVAIRGQAGRQGGNLVYEG